MGTGRGPRNCRVANQPLGFDSLALLGSLDELIGLDIADHGAIL